MSRISAIIILANVAFSSLGCVVRTRPEYAHRRHRHDEHREVIVVHHRD